MFGFTNIYQIVQAIIAEMPLKESSDSAPKSPKQKSKYRSSPNINVKAAIFVSVLILIGVSHTLRY